MHTLLGWLSNELPRYGYWLVLVCVAIESTGVPFPGETVLVLAAIYAAGTHHLSLPGVIFAAAAGAIAGDNLGFAIGRRGGVPLARWLARRTRSEDKLEAGRRLFRQHGPPIVFFGRFVTVLRTWAAFIAGTSHMSWRRFLFYNAAGGLVWATLWGLMGYFVGVTSGPLRYVAIGLAVLAIGVSFAVARRRAMS